MSLKDILNSVTGRNKALKPTESAPPAALPSDSFPKNAAVHKTAKDAV